MLELKVRKIGNSLGVILPAEATREMNVEQGDTLYLIKSEDGFQLTPFAPDFEGQLKVARLYMRKYRNALRELAK